MDPAFINHGRRVQSEQLVFCGFVQSANISADHNNAYGLPFSKNSAHTSLPDRNTTVHLRPNLESSARNKSNVSGKGL